MYGLWPPEILECCTLFIMFNSYHQKAADMGKHVLNKANTLEHAAARPGSVLGAVTRVAP